MQVFMEPDAVTKLSTKKMISQWYCERLNGILRLSVESWLKGPVAEHLAWMHGLKNSHINSVYRSPGLDYQDIQPYEEKRRYVSRLERIGWGQVALEEISTMHWL